MTSTQVVSTEMDMVKDADIVYFILDNSSQPGTITELINASKQNKLIRIYYIGQEIDEGEPDRVVSSALWYPVIFSQLANDRTYVREVFSREEAVKLIKEDVNGRF